ncbi:MAG: signal peptidase II [Candidatus Neomarinimicrobiota bacterium]|nr:MAG: signal peptidase II [Candidatus Neomarinimicrobiota bacterium]
MKILYVTGLVFLLDQASKTLVRSTMDLHQSISIIPGFFNLTYVTNTGMAFGWNFPGGPLFFTTASILLTLVLLRILWKERSGPVLVRLALSLILAGAFGNLFDRLFRSEVVDFFDFYWQAYHFYIFNVADSSVTIGIGLYLWYTLFVHPKTEDTLPTP